jgi:hypothetical protein
VTHPRRRCRRDWGALIRSTLAISLALWTGCGITSRTPLGVSLQRGAGQLLPTRVRRLSNIELERSVQYVLRGHRIPSPVSGGDALAQPEIARRLPPDVRQAGFSRNAQQSLPTATGVIWSTLMEEVTQRAVDDDISRFIACASEVCRREFVTVTARRAWRRPAEAAEVGALLVLFEQGEDDSRARLSRASAVAPASSAGRVEHHADLRGGVQLVLSALLQSPSFMYASELGDRRVGEGEPVRLAPFEIAQTLSYTLSGSPPDEPLLELAANGELVSSAVRREEARRILGKSATRHHFRRFVLEWLEVDQLESTAKDAEQHPRYDQLKSHMLEETRAYTDEVMVNHGASVAALLNGGFVSVDPAMARYYELEAFGPVVPLGGRERVGVLQHASFLSSHAHPDSTSPVRRGDFVLRKVLCKQLPRPAELGIEVVMPRPRPGESARARLINHTSDPACQSCHQTIDPLGFSFEGFDAAGRERTTDAGLAIDSSATLDLYAEKLSFRNSVELSEWLAQQTRTRECFARQAFRYFTAQSDERTEPPFLHLVRDLPPERRDSLIEMLVEYAGSDMFIYRQYQPAEAYE